MRRCAIALLVAAPLALEAQVDSLLRALDDQPLDTTRLPTLTAIIRSMVFTAPDSALRHVDEYRALAADGTILQKAKGENLAGMCYSVKGEHAVALPHYMAALDGFEQAGDTWYTAMLHNNIGSVHKEEGRLDLAEREISVALRGFTAEGDTIWMANTLNNLANIRRSRNELDSALVYYERAVVLLQRINAPEHAASIRYNQAIIHADRGDHASALPMYRSALELLGGANEDQLRAMVLTEVGLTLLQLDSAGQSSGPLHEALAVSIAGGFKKQRSSAHRALTEYFERTHRPDSALFHHKAFAQWNDSVFSEEKSAQIDELQENYDSGKKDALISRNKAQLEQRSLTIKAVATGALLLLVAALFAFRAYRVKRKGEAALAKKNAVIEAQLKEKELLLREIHHRVKNNLQTVSSLLSIQGRGITDAKAKEAVNDSRLRVKSMALIHQDLYREGDITGVRMKEYVEKLVASLITSYAMSDRVRLLVEVEDIALDVDTAVPIGLVLNELVTNAMKYAWPGERAGRLTVKLAHRIGVLALVVADDGIGTAPAPNGDEASGFGLNMVRTFATKLKAEWTIRNENGTVVDLTIRNFKLAR